MLYSRYYKANKKIETLGEKDKSLTPEVELSKEDKAIIAEAEKLKKLLELKLAVESGEVKVESLKKGEKAALKKLGVEL